jgi:hypothetical protein
MPRLLQHRKPQTSGVTATVDTRTRLTAAKASHPAARRNSRHARRAAARGFHLMYSYPALSLPETTAELEQPFQRTRGVASV